MRPAKFYAGAADSADYLRPAAFDRFDKTFGIGHVSKYAALHLDRFDRRLMVAHIGRAGAVFHQDTPVAVIVRFAHDRMYAYVGGDAAVWEKLPQIQNALVEKSGVVSTAHAQEHAVTAALEGQVKVGTD